MASEKILEAKCFAAYFQMATVMDGFGYFCIVGFSVFTDTYCKC
ncbi:MAG: hypothetical protein ACO245_06925 [Ilumatobacteraceae bacterium]